MSAPFNKHDLDALEVLVDRYGLTRTLEALAEICEEKACHVAENWQDEKLATQWDKAADAIDTFTGTEDLPS